MNKNSQADTHIRVVCRLRPLNELEKREGGECAVSFQDKNIKIKVKGDDQQYDFSFDKIFGSETPQKEVFNIVAKPIIDGVMSGYNGTIFAYGQTSSGKTFTMEGPSIDNDEMKGIIPRMMDTVFDHIVNASGNIEFIVKISFLEIYNEKIHDLLDPKKTNLTIKEDRNKGIFVADSTEVYVNTVEQMKKVMHTGAGNRSVAATRMNERSSRSHSIFLLTINQRNIKTDTTKQSKLYFVDLAGSEKVGKTHVSGKELDEAKNINRSLSALGNVINALTSEKQEHVPYRDSKLTRILQESIGGNSKTCLIIACSMCSYNDKETLSTLRFGYRAKCIKNTPTINEERSAKELKALLEIAEKKLKQQENTIRALQMQLEGNGTGIDHSFSSFMTEKNETDVSIRDPILNDVEMKKNSSTEPKETDNKKSNKTSLKILKMHINLTNLSDEHQKLQVSKRELENELISKNNEIAEFRDKLNAQDENFNTFINRYKSDITNMQVSYEKLYHENQSSNHLLLRLKREMGSLKEDLSFLLLSNNLASICQNGLGHDTNSPGREHAEEREPMEVLSQSKIVESIQKIINLIENVELAAQENESKFKNDEQKQHFVADDNASSERMLTYQSDNSDKIFSNQANSPFLSSTSANRNNKVKEDILSTAENLNTEDSELGREDLIETPPEQLMKHETVQFEKNLEELQKRIISLETPEEKITELQNLIISQRKTIESYSRINHELSQSIEKQNNNIDSRVNKYKKQLNEMKKFSTGKVKELDVIQKKLNQARLELDENKKRFDREMASKAQLISEYKIHFDKLQKMVGEKHHLKRIQEMETKLKEVGMERQNTFNQMFKLREQLHEKEDMIAEKDNQIRLLNININTLINQIEAFKFVKNSHSSLPYSSGTQKEYFIQKPENHHPHGDGLNMSISTPKNNRDKSNEFNFFDKNIIKPLRGGGGDLRIFKKNNFITQTQESVTVETDELEREEQQDFSSSDDDKDRSRRDSKAMLKLVSLSKVRLKPSEMKKSIRKFDEMLQRKGLHSSMVEESSFDRSFRIIPVNKTKHHDSHVSLSSSRGFFEAEDIGKKKEATTQERHNRPPMKMMKSQNTSSSSSLFSTFKNFFL